MIKKISFLIFQGVAIVDISDANGSTAITELNKSFEGRVIFIKTDITKEEELKGCFS